MLVSWATGSWLILKVTLDISLLLLYQYAKTKRHTLDVECLTEEQVRMTGNLTSLCLCLNLHAHTTLKEDT